MTNSWFPGESGGAESSLLFSFTQDDGVDILSELIEESNKHLEACNSIKAVVVPIEKHI